MLNRPLAPIDYRVFRRLRRHSAPLAYQLAVLVICWVAWSPRADAANLMWDANTGLAGAQDGSGTWDTTTADWYNGTGDVVWPNTTDTAIFGAGTAGAYTITLSNPVNAGAITFKQAGYTISGSGIINLNPPAAQTPNFVVTTAASGGTDTVSSTLAGAAGTIFTKTGPGTLAISTISGGTAANPTVGIVTGGTYNATIGAFDSILAFNYGNTFGTQPASPTIQFLLDSGTLQFTGGSGSNSLAANRSVKISTAGGGIIDPGTLLACQVVDDAGSNNAFYITNSSGATTTLQSTALISGPGGVTFNGAGTLIFQGLNTYTGATVVNKGTLELNGGALPNNNLTLAAGTTLNLQGGYLLFNLSISSDRLAVQGNLTTGGVNYVRLALGNLSGLTLGTYPLVTAAGTLSLAGTYQLDGGAGLSVPSTSAITQLGGTTIADGNGASTGGMTGGTFYRLTPQPASTGVQYVVAAAPANVINLMPLGSSITEGISASANYAGGGYRSQLYQMLVNDGRFSPNFEGSNTVLDNATPSGYNVLTSANQLHHEGHGGYTTTTILTNLNANAGTGSNDGGYWLASTNNGVNPDYVTLSIGGNDYGGDGTQTTQPLSRVDAIVSYIQQLRPASNVVLSNLFYRTQTAPNAPNGYNVGDLQDAYYNPGIPGVVFNHILAGQHVTFADQFDPVTPNKNVSNIGPDGIHPLVPGYQFMATNLYKTVAFGSAYWTGAQGDGNWSTVIAGGGTNFAQNYQLTTPYSMALGSATDVYFNNNTGALATSLGQNLTVRSVNFSAGAAGPVTIGPGANSANTLTIGLTPTSNTLFDGVGGITVQNGSGAHTISANVVLGGPQSVSASNNQIWGNVSANTFTVTGNISGKYGLTLTNSYTIQVPVSATSSSTTTQMGSGTAGTTFILSGSNTYSGATTMTSGRTVVNNTSGSGTGTGPVSVGQSATLINNGSISGAVSVNGVVGGGGTFAGAVTVNNGGTFSAAATVNGPLSVNAGGLVALSSGVLTVNGRVMNNGTIRLDHGAALAVGNAAATTNAVKGSTRAGRVAASSADGGATFVNNGTLDIMTGDFSAPAGFTNNGVVLDSRVVQVKSVSKNGGAVTVAIDSYSGHTYQLQCSDSLDGGTFTNLGATQSGADGVALTFQDANPSANQGFYRVQVDP